MPVTVQWYVEDTILIVEYVARVTIDERQAGSARMLAYFQAADHPIHVIGDWRRAGQWPAAAGVTSQSMNALSHKNMGWLAVVGMSPTLENWVEVLSQLYSVRYLVAGNVEEAAGLLHALS
jgi:hypothetical protein